MKYVYFALLMCLVFSSTTTLKTKTQALDVEIGDFDPNKTVDDAKKAMDNLEKLMNSLKTLSEVGEFFEMADFFAFAGPEFAAIGAVFGLIDIFIPKPDPNAILLKALK